MTDRDIEAAMAAGARTASAVCRATGAARDCGTCIFNVKALVCRHRDRESLLEEIDGAAS